MKLRPFKHAPSLIALAIIAIVCLLRISDPNWVERLERMTYDSRVRAALKHPTTVATNLGFVFIDEESIHYVTNEPGSGIPFWTLLAAANLWPGNPGTGASGCKSLRDGRRIWRYS